MLNCSKRNLLGILFVVLTVIYIIFMFSLSTQNGTETAETSGNLANIISRIFYQSPTEAQVNFVHFYLRKLAHVFLYSLLGVLITISCNQINKDHLLANSAFSSLLIVAISFFDEGQKLFIEGRHFDLNEVILNLVSGVIFIILTQICLSFIKKIISK